MKSPRASWWTALFPPQLLVPLLFVSILTNVVLIVRVAFPARWEAWRWALRPPPPVSADDHVVGSGPTTVIEYADFECPFCAEFQDAMREVLGEGDVRWVYRHYPIAAIHPGAVRAAEAAECAAEQGRFWAFGDSVYTRQGELSPAQLSNIAAGAGADRRRFDECVQSRRYRARVADQIRAAERIGIRATPTFFVDGTRYEGFVSRDSLRSLLRTKLKTSD